MAVDIRDPEQLPGVSRATGIDLAARMSALYGDAEQQLAEHIARNLRAGIESPSWALDKMLAVGQLRDWTRQLLRRLDSDARDEIRYAMVSAYMQGGTEATRALAAATNSLPEWINKAGIDPDARIQGILNGRRSELEAGVARLTRAIPGLAGLQRMIGSLALRITGTHLPVLRWAEDAYRQTIAAAALPDVLLGTLTRRAASQKAWGRLLGDGITGFTDKSGRPWNLATYVEMATRSGVAQAAVEGHLDRLSDAGIDLVIVSNAPQECKRCRPWEGKILARSGPSGRRTIQVEHATTGELIEVEIWGTVDDAVADGLLHPNCRHSLSAYLPGVTRVPTHTQDPDGDEARQHLRQLERETRKAKLQAAAVIDPAAKAPLEAKVREKQAEIRQHVADTEHLGIMRKREREQPDLGNSAGLNAGKQTPKPQPLPKPTAAAPAKAATAADDQLTTVREASTKDSPAAKKHAAEQAKATATPTLDEVRAARLKLQRAKEMHGFDRRTWPKKDQQAAEKLDKVIARYEAPADVKHAQAHLGKLCDHGVEPKHRPAVSDALSRQAELTPQAALHLKGVHLVENGPAADAFHRDYPTAWAYHLSPELHLNPDWAANPARIQGIVREAHASGYLSPSGSTSMGSVVSHEYGHHVARRFMTIEGHIDEPYASRFMMPLVDALGATRDVKGVGGFDVTVPREWGFIGNLNPGRVHVNVLNAWVADNADLITRQVSRYGATKFSELLAEIWQEYSTMADHARPHIRRIGRLMQALAEEASRAG